MARFSALDTGGDGRIAGATRSADLYGYFFGARHRLEKLDPAYTTPSALAPFAFAAIMIFIALSKYFEWW